MYELTYNSCLFHRCKPFDIIGLQTRNILILANDNFVGIEKEAIKITKFMTKKQACFLPQILIKFNNTWILLMLNKDITLNQKT